MTSKLIWLHLSDLHCCKRRTGWDSKQVLSSLTADLRSMQKRHDLLPDMIFFTGDAVFGELGNEPGLRIQDQFSEAGDFFERVRTSFYPEIPRENVFLVPGNHDVNRLYVSDDQITWLDGQKELATVIDLIQRKPLQWKRYIERLHDYRDFLQTYNYNHLLTDPERLTYAVTRDIRGAHVNIVGLNSAWSCCRDGEKGKLWMAGRWQIGHLTSPLPSADLSIALMHHPPNWLVEQEDPHLVRDIEREFDFSLHGHEHKEWVTHTPSHTRIAAGACYDSPDGENGYNFVRLNLDTGKGEVWLRRYHSDGAGWVPDAVPNKTNNDGLWQLTEVPRSAMGGPLVMSTSNTSSNTIASVPIPIIYNPPFRQYGPDLRPVVDAWVGRADELSALVDMNDGVVAVTGIGGQGKSALVSKFLDRWNLENSDAFWDWRDCREEGERFLTQLIAMIEHVTSGGIGKDYFSGADTKAIIRYFFELVGEKKGVVVLDNVDFYVNQSDEKFSLGVGLFVQEALRVHHNLLVILTCRPRVSYPDPRFLEIPLKGINLPEAYQLFRLRGIKVDHSTEREVEEIWERTAGHPLWLNLIAVQMNRNPQTAPAILQELRKGQVDDRTRSMLRALWKGLSDRQRTILRCMAEVSYPESQESIQRFVGILIKSSNQFNRAFEGIKALSLVVERGFGRQGKTFDLHPLVRSFIRTEYPSEQERLPYVRPILVILAQLIKGLAGPSENAALEDLQRWTTKAELELAASDNPAALKTLSRAADQLIARGFHEEFFRVGKLLLERIDWNEIEMQDSRQFFQVVSSIIITLVEHHREPEGRAYLSRFQEAGGERTVARLHYYHIASYVEWMLRNYKLAIELGREGLLLKAESHIDTEEDTSHTLALALRDNGDLDEALKIFALDQPIENILADDHFSSGKKPEFYGNIGRCLQLKHDLRSALRCYVKSAELLLKSSGATDILNRGYAALWIGEVMEELGDYEIAFCFYRMAAYIWTMRMPLRVGEPMEGLARVRPFVHESWASMSNNAVDKYCRNWIANRSNYN
jgi:tetratricopeptide (TPR) repeat protein